MASIHYTLTSSRQMNLEDNFFLPFGGNLRSDNRWVILAKNIPWDAIEEKYVTLFSDVGQPAKPIRMAVGSLMLREKLQLSDEESVYYRLQILMLTGREKYAVCQAQGGLL